MELSKIKANPSNPRIIRDEKFKKLIKSLQEFPEMMEHNIEGVQYKRIKDYEGYLFGEDGSVISFRGQIKEVLGSPDKDGYLKITLVDKNGKFKYFRKHRLIIEAFNGKSNMEVNHKDGNKTNNALKNLEYVTLRENQSHRRLKEGYEVGVCWARKEKKWRAYIQENKKWQHLGFYDEKEDAKKAYIDKLEQLKIINRYAENN